MALVIAALAMENVPEVPPTMLPKVPEYVRTEPMVGVDVAMLVTVLFPEAYTTWPEERLEEVARPVYVKAPVELLYASGKVAESAERARVSV
jgi:hypothetical protein